MARTKKVNKFDFSGVPALKKPVDSIDMSAADMATAIETLINRNRSNGTYVSNYADGYLNQLKNQQAHEDNSWVINWAKRFLFNGDPAYKEAFNKKVLEWYATHEGAQEVYKACAKNRWWWNNLDGTNTQVTEAEQQGRFEKPANYLDFISVIESSEGRSYMETNREQVFEVGDVVVLRLPYVGSYDYDPHYRNETMTRADRRYGTVMEEGSGDIATRYPSKGSRAISVLWFGKSEVVTVPERILKFESRKGRG